MGGLLIDAKRELVHGEWERMFEDGLIPFTASTARRLMAVAEHPLISDRAHGHVLPPSWRTLYELTKVPERTLKNALKDGAITADMPRPPASAPAKQAKNKQLEIDAAEIRIRAERRVGELMQAQRETVGLNEGQLHRGSKLDPRDDKPTLEEAGIDKHMADRARKLAAVDDACVAFAARVGHAL